MNEALVDPADAAAARGGTPEVRRERLWLDVKYAGRLLLTYLKEDRRLGAALVFVVILVTIIDPYVVLSFSVSQSQAINALAARNAGAFWDAVGFTATLILPIVVLAIVKIVIVYALRIRMRAVYTASLLDRWLSNDRFYHTRWLGEVDHPEQRVQEDVFIFCQNVMLLAPEIITVAMNLYLYTAKLWELAPSISLGFIGLPIESRAVLPVAAYVFGIGMTALTHLVGKSLTKAEVARQRLEALFRAEMADIRENAEAVAFEKGGPIERQRLGAIFGLIRRNWRLYTIAQAKLSGMLAWPNSLLLLAPMVLAAPFVLNGTLQVGDVTLIGTAFMVVNSSVSIIANRYENFAILRSAVVRMRSFEAALDVPFAPGIVRREGGEAIVAKGLRLDYPSGETMIASCSLTIARGDRILVRGKSGVGKSTLLRALAGLWPHGAGRVEVPGDRKITFLPQRSYMPDGTLAGLLSYPHEPIERNHRRYAELLCMVGLNELAPRLAEHASWRNTLSPGQQQRLAAVRAVLAEPDFLFLDEGTSALDLHSEITFYTFLDKNLPDTAIISVAHRSEVAKFHTKSVDLDRGVCSVSDLSMIN